MKKKLLATLVAGAALGWGGAANAILFDFQDGNTVDIAAVDWAQTSLGVENGTQAITNFIQSGGNCVGEECDFTFYTHARLTGVTDSSGADVTPTNLNNSYEITMTMAVTERVTGFVGNPGEQNAIAQFATVTNSGEWLEMWYDATPDYNDVQGFGFNDGTLILTGSKIASATGFFSITGDTPVQMDQFQGNNAASDSYGDGSGVAGQSQLTVSGTGSNTSLNWDQLVQDNNYFNGTLDTFGILFQNISVGLPFGTVDPSDCFTDNASGLAVGGLQGTGHDCASVHVDGLYASNDPDGLDGWVPTVGNVNGAALNVGGGVDFVAQTDFNGSFNGQNVPEPSTMALMGLGLLGFGAFGAARKRRA